MSVETLALVLHHSRAEGTTKLVLIGIANHAGDGGAWPSVSTLARYANCTERTVQRAIGKLIQLGEVGVERNAGGLAYLKHWERPNRYDVLVRCPQNCDRSAQHRLVDHPSYPQEKGQNRDLFGMSDSDRSDPVTLVSPGDAGVTGGGDTGVTLTVHRTPTVHPHVPTVTHTREARSSADPETRRNAIEQARRDLALARSGKDS